MKKEAQRPSDENIFFYELKNKMTVSSQQIPVHNEMNINVYGGIDLEDFFLKKIERELSRCVMIDILTLFTIQSRKSPFMDLGISRVQC